MNNYREIVEFSHLPWLKLDIEVPHEAMLEEAINIQQYYVAHRSEESVIGLSHKGWSSTCIHGIEWNKTNHYTSYGYESNDSTPYKWTIISDLCPTITKFFKYSFPMTEYYRLRIMKLEARGFIMPHKDMEENRLSPINISLNQPKECIFKMRDKGVVPFSPGDAYLLDVGNEHAVINNSNEDRYHIIVHGIPNKDYKELVIKSYAKK